MWMYNIHVSQYSPLLVFTALVIAVTTWQSHQELNETTASPLVQQVIEMFRNDPCQLINSQLNLHVNKG